MINEKNINNLINNKKILDSNISLEALGLYYTMFIDAMGDNHSLKEVVDYTKIDKDNLYVVLIELLENDLLSIGLKINDNEYFMFDNI